jgi:hypothetical protein
LQISQNLSPSALPDLIDLKSTELYDVLPDRLQLEETPFNFPQNKWIKWIKWIKWSHLANQAFHRMPECKAESGDSKQHNRRVFEREDTVACLVYLLHVHAEYR